MSASQRTGVGSRLLIAVVRGALAVLSFVASLLGVWTGPILDRIQEARLTVGGAS